MIKNYEVAGNSNHYILIGTKPSIHSYSVVEEDAPVRGAN